MITTLKKDYVLKGGWKWLAGEKIEVKIEDGMASVENLDQTGVVHVHVADLFYMSDEFKPAIMKPSKEILEIARNKAAMLFEGTQIRVGGAEYEKSYWVFRPKGGEETYIGSMANEPLPKFFKRLNEYVLEDFSGKKISSMQKMKLAGVTIENLINLPA